MGQKQWEILRQRKPKKAGGSSWVLQMGGSLDHHRNGESCPSTNQTCFVQAPGSATKLSRPFLWLITFLVTNVYLISPSSFNFQLLAHLVPLQL